MTSFRRTTRGHRLLTTYWLQTMLTNRLALDDILGCKNGRFVLHGTGVSQYMKNAYLDGLMLHAELLCSSGAWRRDTIDLNTAIFSSQSIFPDFLSSLDGLLGNVDGILVEPDNHSEGFLKLAENVRLEGDMLRARLQRLDGSWVESSIDCVAILRKHFQTLAWTPGYYEPSVTLDAVKALRMMPCVSLIIKQPLLLQCELQQPDGSYERSTIDLADMLETRPANELGKFIASQGYHFSHHGTAWVFKQADIHTPKLTGTILSAFLPGTGPRLHHSSIDLAGILANENGKLIMRRDPPFCLQCKDLFLSSTFHRKVEPVNIMMDTRQHTACPVCDMLSRATVAFAPPDIDSSRASISIYTILATGRDWVDQVEVKISYNDAIEIPLQLWSLSNVWEDSFHFRTLPVKRQRRIEVADEHQRAELALTWIDECIRNHKTCAKLIRTSRLPTRLLYIGVSADDNIRLVAGSHFDETYACLSYCWGGQYEQIAADEYILTKSRLSDYHNKIESSILPQTFRDIIDFARLLGIRLLWIDSLCILQDSKEDWQQESTRMDQYYSDCLVCLATTASASARSGCQIKQHRPIITANGLGNDNLPYSIGLFPEEMMPRSLHFSRSLQPEVTQQQFPLLHRAWAYQERRLAPRIIHFCGYEILMECYDGTMCECGGVHADDSAWSKSQQPQINIMGSSISYSGDTNVETSVRRWHADMTTYSHRNLTYRTDCLSAIAGIAKADRNHFGRKNTQLYRGEYYAGVWQNHMPYDLMWRTGTVNPTVEVSKGSRLEEYIAPSWSWASTGMPVEFWTTTAQIREHVLVKMYDGSTPALDPEGVLIYLHTVNTVPKADPFGQILDGHMEVSGRLIPTWWRYDTPMQRPHRLTVLEEMVFLPDYAEMPVGGVLGDPMQEVYILPVHGSVVLGQDFLGHYNGVYCLVLSRVESRNGLATYARLGSATYGYTGLSKDSFEQRQVVKDAKMTRFIIV